ncbi:MAG: hypothetical protein H7Z42_05660 [Roseiflexaceae bacterium]|nr:hypothetical protein [Roseiflexaceae bacterium]
MDFNAIVDAINRSEDNFERAMLARSRARRQHPGTNPVAWDESRTLESLAEDVLRPPLTTEESLVLQLGTPNIAAAYGAALQIPIAYA